MYSKVFYSFSFTNLFTKTSRLKFEKEFNAALLLALQTPLQGYIAGQEGMRLRPDRFHIFKNINGEKLIIRMVEAESILAVSDEKPDDVILGKEYNDGQGVDIDPSQFVNAQ